MKSLSAEIMTKTAVSWFKYSHPNHGRRPACLNDVHCTDLLHTWQQHSHGGVHASEGSIASLCTGSPPPALRPKNNTVVVYSMTFGLDPTQPGRVEDRQLRFKNDVCLFSFLKIFLGAVCYLATDSTGKEIRKPI